MTLADALTARDNALRRVDENADPAWKDRALEAVRLTCQTRPDWISDDVWETGLDSTREDRALGAVVRKAARLGWCERTDRVRPSARSHGSGKPVWRSLIYEPGFGDGRLFAYPEAAA